MEGGGGRREGGREGRGAETIVRMNWCLCTLVVSVANWVQYVSLSFSGIITIIWFQTQLFASYPAEEDWARFVSSSPFMLVVYLYHWVMGELEGEGEGELEGEGEGELEGEGEGEGGACTNHLSIIISALFNTFQHCKQWHYFAKCHYHEMVNFGQPIIALVIWWRQFGQILSHTYIVLVVDPFLHF